MESSRKDILLHTQITKKLRENNKEAAEVKDKTRPDQTPVIKRRPRLPAYVNPH